MSERKIVKLPGLKVVRPKPRLEFEPVGEEGALSNGRAIDKLCTAHKKDGSRCGNYARRGSRVCGFHGGKTKAALAKAQERILAASDIAAKRMIEFMNDVRVPYAVRVSAAKDLLDRAGLAGKQTLSVELSSFEQLTERIVDGRITVADDYADVIDAEIVEDTEKSQTAPGDSPAVTDNLPTDGVGDAAVPDTANLSDRPPARVRGARRARDPGVPWLR